MARRSQNACGSLSLSLLISLGKLSSSFCWNKNNHMAIKKQGKMSKSTEDVDFLVGLFSASLLPSLRPLLNTFYTRGSESLPGAGWDSGAKTQQHAAS